MKQKILLLLGLALCYTLPSMAQESDVSDLLKSDCLTKAPEVVNESLPTIILTKEGKILSVQVQNFKCNCGTRDFDVKSDISGGNDPYSLSISIVPVIPAAMDCICPFNISFTVRDFEPNSFYLECWFYEGQVELKEGEPLVLNDSTNGIEAIDSSSQSPKTVFNLQGQRVESVPRKGVYIQNGKKVVIKIN